jgi:signal transduction histidine kinase
MQKIKIIKDNILSKDVFQRARLHLTLYYVLIMFIILTIFSTVLLFTLQNKVRENFKGRFDHRVNEERFDKKVFFDKDIDPIDKTNDDMQALILLIDGLLLIIISFASYYLSGKTLRPIKQTLESQKKFLADASHDLRTPIAIMTTDIEVTLQSVNSSKEDFKRLAMSNLEESKNMNLLVNNLLTLARGDNYKTEISNVYLSNILNIIVDKMQSQAEVKNIKLEKNIQEDIFVNANKEDLQRAISNILQNAINYTKVGSITINLKKQNNKIILEIIDTGVGIKEKDLPFVFDRFFKAEHSRNDGNGSGLGLLIAKEMVERVNNPRLTPWGITFNQTA